MTYPTTRYRLMGLPLSPYSMKVQAYFDFKGLDYQWVSRSMKNEKLFQEHAKVQLIPLLFLPNGEVMQDSTPIIERLEAEYPQPSVQPEDPALWLLSCLFEEFGDEWCNKLMFFQRWFYPADAKSTGDRLAGYRLEGQWWGALAKPILSHLMVRRMVPRLSFAGANETNIPQLKQSFIDLSAMLDAHFATRSYLLGGRPCFGDFGLWCNYHQAWTDPTANAYLEANAPNLVAYIKRMLAPSVEGELESLDSLLPTLEPILSSEVAERFLPWMAANHAAFNAGEKETSLTMKGAPFRQKTFKYQVATLDELRRKLTSVGENEQLIALLERTGCLPYLKNKES